MADTAVQYIPEQVEAAPRWPLPLRILFRFLFCYWLLYAMPDTGRVSIFSYIPGSQLVTGPYIDLWHAVVPWVAIHMFHVTGRPATYFPTGSGDTTLDYIQNLLFLVISLAATVIWSILDRRRPDYRTLHGWLRVLVRYTLAFTLFSYGFAKVFPLQFQPPPFGRLIEPYGEFSPMGVLWSFMGASIPYIIFSGAAEVSGGLLLLFRRTTTLGALVSFAVMLNVATLNFCYDVPVKLYSTNLVLMALFLAAPDFRRLANVFVLNRTAVPSDLTRPHIPRRWVSIAATLFSGYVVVMNVINGWQSYQQYYVKPERPLLYGLYDVESGPDKWRKVTVPYPKQFAVRTTDDEVLRFTAEYGNNTITLNGGGQFTWSRPDSDHLLLEGTLNGAPATVRLRKIDTGKFLLLNRGFHWINETPFNR